MPARRNETVVIRAARRTAPGTAGSDTGRSAPRAIWGAWHTRALLLVAPALGALASLALAPRHWLPLLPVAFGGLLWLLDRASEWRGAAVAGWLFGFGHFLAGLSWITASFQVDAERFGAFAVPALVGLSAGLALFPALAAALAKATAGGGWRLLLALAASWSAAEWLRGHVLTGFPWNLVGYAWGISDETLQAASVLGIYGLGFVTVLLAALPGLVALNRGSRSILRWWPVGAAALGALALWGFGAARLAQAEGGEVPGVRLRLVQPSIPQAAKWDPAERERILERLLALSASPAKVPPTHLVWPETAVPYVFAEGPAVRRTVASVIPPGGALLTGVVRRVPDFERDLAYLNSLVALDEAGEIIAAYDKVHLVPFGEYMPLREILPFKKLTQGNVDFAPGTEHTVLTVPGLPPAGPMICYEAIFPGADWVGPPPRWLLNVTNDAWFGVSSGPYQHFLAARVRAVEEGLPLVRAANTGISAVVDAYGRVQASLPLNAVGFIDTALPAPTADETFYTTWGDAPLVAFLSTVAATLAATQRRRSSKNRDGRQTAQP